MAKPSQWAGASLDLRTGTLRLASTHMVEVHYSAYPVLTTRTVRRLFMYFLLSVFVWVVYQMPSIASNESYSESPTSIFVWLQVVF